MRLAKGTPVLLHTGSQVLEGTVVSGRMDRRGCVLVERRRINPDVQEAMWWRTPRSLVVLGTAS